MERAEILNSSQVCQVLIIKWQNLIMKISKRAKFNERSINIITTLRDHQYLFGITVKNYIVK